MHEISNGLILIKTKSNVNSGLIIDDLDNVNQYINVPSYVVAYLDNEVLIGKYNRRFYFPENRQIEERFIQHIRIFNPDEELHAWRYQGKLTGRYRVDNQGKEIDLVEAEQVIFGAKAEYKNDYTILTEKIGTRIVLPGKWITDNGRTRVALKLRHYIYYKYGYQATYVDARFVDFVQLPKGGE